MSTSSTSREGALAAARQEAATLRTVLDAIQGALAAAISRLEALEAQVNGRPPHSHAALVSPSAVCPSAAPMPASNASGASGASNANSASEAAARQGRSPAEWKSPTWTPAPGDEAVTGETLRARREALGISQASVAHAAHCSRGLVAEVERGKRRSAQTLAHLSTVLDRLQGQARRT